MAEKDKDRSSELATIRDEFDSDYEDWSQAREERAEDLKCLSGDPWKPEDRTAREDAGRPCLTTDELSQYVNQIINDLRSNPRSVQFAPTKPGTSEDLADFYSDKMREIEYRSNAQLAYIMAAENAIQGGYGFVRVTSEFEPDSVDRQEICIKPVMDPNTIVPNWNFERPDLSDMRRCFVLERRPIKDFLLDFPKAKKVDFGSYATDKALTRWVDEQTIQLAERWYIEQQPITLLLVQPPPVQPPPGAMNLRPMTAPPPISIRKEDWGKQPPGTTVIREREATEPLVRQCLVNGVEILKETTWPGPYIPIAGCMGRILYVDDKGKSARLLMSAIRLAREPFMAECFIATSELEVVGTITKNPYWAYEGQVDPNQQNEIAKSMHEPVAVLFAKAKIEGVADVLPLPVRNPMALDLSGYAALREEFRRSVQAAMATNFLPSAAQQRSEKSGAALEKINQTFMKGSAHFADHFGLMRRHVGVICEAAMDTFYDTARQVTIRKADDTTAHVWVNNPQQEDSIDLKDTHMAVTVSEGPSVDSTREAASDFADDLLANVQLMQLLGPAKAQQIAALAIKLKVKQTGIGAIGEQIGDIIAPPTDGEITPEMAQQLQQEVQQLKQQLQQAQQEIGTKVAAKQAEMQGRMAIEQQKSAATSADKDKDREVKLAIAELSARIDRLSLFYDERARLGVQDHEARQAVHDRVHEHVQGVKDRQHEMAINAADAAHEKDLAATSALTALAQPQEPGQPSTGAGA